MSSRSRTSVSRAASAVSFGVARLLTGRARARYATHYQGVHRRPRLAFVFDATLLLIAATLVGVLVWVLQLPVPPPGIRLTLSTPPVEAGAPLPFIVTLHSADGHTHENVRIRWHLPPGSELLEADPPLSLEGESFVGIVSPASPATSRVVIRTFLPEGSVAPFGFTVTYGSGHEMQEFFGEGTREVTQSALTAVVPELFQVARVTPRGAVLPLRVENTTDLSVPFAFVRIKTHWSSLPDGHTIPLGNLPPHTVRWVYVDVPEPAPHESFAWMEWHVGAASRDLASGFWRAEYALDTVAFPRVTGALTSRPTAPTTLALSSTAQTADVLIVHPLLPQPVARITVSDNGTFTIPAISTTESPNHEWFVAPIQNQTLGPAWMGTIQTDLPFATSIRYTASSGDQLGAGPVPPRVDTETRYWVFWTVGPIDSALQSIQVRTTLPSGVAATGNVTAPDGGAYTAIGRTVNWSLPTLGDDRARALFGFEIATTPTESDIGQALMLMATSTASARDTHSSLQFTAQQAPLFSTLEEFESAKGIVVE